MGAHVAVAHYPEGAGHATRMLAVAQALEDRGATVTLAGGGPGARFIESNGYEQFEPTPVEYIDDYQAGSLAHVLAGSLPRSAGRVRDYVGWLRRERPDALLTDDMFAAMAAPLARTPLYVLTHNAAALYDAVIEQAFTWLLNRYQIRAARTTLYPSIWPPESDDPPNVTRVPPLALAGSDRATADSTTPPAEGGVLLVPSAYSAGFGVLADRLRDAGHRVTLVGGPDWECVPSLLPHVRAADRVVCSGYSTIMEAAVAGTPCVVYPFTDEQHGVSRHIERTGIDGFQVEHSIPHAVRAVGQPLAPPDYENGAARAAAHVLDDLA